MHEYEQASWRGLLNRRAETCPSWYAEAIELDERARWNAEMGEGFSDWYDEYLEMQIESAREARRGPAAALDVQPFLPGLEEPSSWISDSF